FNTHLNLGQQTPIVERDFVPLTKEELTVWNSNHPAPEFSVENELKIVRSFAADQERQFASLIPTNTETQKVYRDQVGGAWDIMIGRKLPGKDEFTQENKNKAESDGLISFRTLVRLPKQNEEIPTLFL